MFNLPTPVAADVAALEQLGKPKPLRFREFLQRVKRYLIWSPEEFDAKVLERMDSDEEISGIHSFKDIAKLYEYAIKCIPVSYTPLTLPTSYHV